MFFSRLAIASLFLCAPAAQAATSAAFSYDPTAENGPAHWGDLDIDGNECYGQSNSPIAVMSRTCDRYDDYTFSKGTCRVNEMTYELTTAGVKASFPSDGSCENPTFQIPGLPGTYQALQFHIHTSSEHTIDGKFFGAELHIVHAEIGGDRFAVVGMMIEPDSPVDHIAFGQLLNGWQEVMDTNDATCAIARTGTRHLTETRRLQAVFNPYALVPGGAAFYHYDGGLTTPPCSEVVWWNLADKAVKISPAQYQQLTDQVLYYVDPTTCERGSYAGPAGSTSRPTQPLNGRKLERVCPTSFEGTDDAYPMPVV